MNIKKGDVLKHKGWNGSRKVLAIVDDCYLMSYTLNQKAGDTFYTLEGLKETFELPEEKWVPKEGGDIYYLDLENFQVRLGRWAGNSKQKELADFGIFFPTHATAEAKLAEILKLLQA